jgi:hypothetical protein
MFLLGLPEKEEIKEGRAPAQSQLVWLVIVSLWLLSNFLN